MSNQLHAISAVSHITDCFRSIEDDMPVSYVRVFLFIARHMSVHNEPPSVSDISEGMDMYSPTVSRITSALGDRRMGGRRAGQEPAKGSRKALGLLERRIDPKDARITRWALAPKGKRLLSTVCQQVER